jgi:sortase A
MKTHTRLPKLIEASLWVIGVLCLCVYANGMLIASVAQARALSSGTFARSGLAVTTHDQSLWSDARIRQYQQSLPEPQQDAIALLAIDAVGIKVAVFEGTEDSILIRGAGRVPGTAPVGAHGNLAIAAHRDSFFRGLKDIHIGHQISLTHADGVDEYAVTELFVVEPQDVWVLDPHDEQVITLITCYPFYFVGNAPKRFIVRATKLDKTPT